MAPESSALSQVPLGAAQQALRGSPVSKGGDVGCGPPSQPRRGPREGAPQGVLRQVAFLMLMTSARTGKHAPESRRTTMPDTILPGSPLSHFCLSTAHLPALLLRPMSHRNLSCDVKDRTHVVTVAHIARPVKDHAAPRDSELVPAWTLVSARCRLQEKRDVSSWIEGKLLDKCVPKVPRCRTPPLSRGQ